uniref:Uncharacterized protein n=1 Tax=Oryza glumipatula TaxID=40148 RepID=A0A0E0AT94_9ORYZ
MAVGMATVVVEFRGSNDDAAFGNGLGRAAPSGGSRWRQGGWHLGASAVDALVDWGSEVKILLRSGASNGDALGHRSPSRRCCFWIPLYQCQVFAGFPEINCAVNARMSSSSDVSATMPCSRSAPQGRGQQGRGKTVGVADTDSSDESGALNDGPAMALVEEHLAAMAMDMGQELSRKIPIIEISNVRLFALHLCGSALASNPQMYGGRATKIM